MKCVVDVVGLRRCWTEAALAQRELAGLLVGTTGSGPLKSVIRERGSRTAVQAYCHGRGPQGAYTGSGRIVAEWHTHPTTNPPSGDDVWQLLLAFHTGMHNCLLVLCQHGWWQMAVCPQGTLYRAVRSLLDAHADTCARPSKDLLLHGPGPVRSMFGPIPRTRKHYQAHMKRLGVLARFRSFTTRQYAPLVAGRPRKRSSKT